MSLHRRPRLTACLAAIGLLVGACGGDDDDTTASTTAPDDDGAADETAGEPTGADTGTSDETESTTSDATDTRGTAAPAGDYASGQGIAVRLPDDWREFDIHNVFEGNTHNMAMNAYATLLFQAPGGELKGYLAEDWEVTADQITFTLKDGVLCADGTELTASMVEASMQHLLDGTGQYNRLLFGPGPYTLSSDDATGTFTFAVGTPKANLEYAFSNYFPASSTGVICPAGLAPDADLTTQMYGAGPYTLTSLTPGDNAVFELREDFAWGPDGVTSETPGIPASITYRVVNNVTTAANLITSGDLNVALIVGPDLERVQADDNLTVFQDVPNAQLPLVFNQTDGHPTADKALRQAMITAVDPKAWIEIVYRGEAAYSDTILPTTTQCYSAKAGELAPEPDIDAARQVLADAGYDVSGDIVTKDGQPVTVKVILPNSINPGPEYLREVWTELGISLDMQVVDYQQYVTAGPLGGEGDITWVTTSAFGPIPDPFVSRLAGPIPPDGVNFARTVDETLNELFDQATRTVGDDACPLWEQVQERMWSEFHLLPMGMPYNYTFGNGVDLSGGLSPLMIRVLA